jgi:hypothetical protein
MIQFKKMLDWLTTHQVDFVIIGGVAANLHGSARATFDLDVCYSRERENLDRLALALVSINARLRNVLPGLPFRLDAETLRRGLNFTFASDLGDLDLLGEVAGVGTFEQAAPLAEIAEMADVTYRFLSLPQLIAAKRAAGRPKDIDALPELEALWEVQQQGQQANEEP